MLISDFAFTTDECAVNTLTEFEIGNVLWKENRKKKLKDPKRLSEIFSEAIRELHKVGIDSVAEVLAIAIERDLTFYDASYVYISENKNLKLVTEDADLLKKCKSAITLKDFKDM